MRAEEQLIHRITSDALESRNRKLSRSDKRIDRCLYLKRNTESLQDLGRSQPEQVLGCPQCSDMLDIFHMSARLPNPSSERGRRNFLDFHRCHSQLLLFLWLITSPVFAHRSLNKSEAPFPPTSLWASYVCPVNYSALRRQEISFSFPSFFFISYPFHCFCFESVWFSSELDITRLAPVINPGISKSCIEKGLLISIGSTSNCKEAFSTAKAEAQESALPTRLDSCTRHHYHEPPHLPRHPTYNATNLSSETEISWLRMHQKLQPNSPP